MTAVLPPGRFNGNVGRSRHLNGLTLTEIHYQPGTQILRHAHELPYFCVVLSGTYSEHYENHTRECEAPDLLFHPSGEIESQTFHSQGGRCFTIEVGPLFVRRTRQDLPLLGGMGGFQHRRLVSLGMRLYREFRCNDTASELAIEGLTLELAAESLRISNDDSRCQHPPSWLPEVEELLREGFMERPTMAQISESVGVHPAQVARLFRRFHGVTVGEFVRQRRVEFACRQLLNTDLPLSQIALDAGFCDQSHFARVFKRSTGMRPTQFRSSAWMR